MNKPETVARQALDWAKEHYPDKSIYLQAAFANSVSYLVTGLSGGYGGPSLREHLVAWSLGQTEAAALPDGTAVTVLVPGSLPPPGQWRFEEACRHAATYCFAPAEQHLETLLCIWEREYTFDNDPEDLEILRGRRS